MLPGAQVCPLGFQTDYTGFLMGSAVASGHQKTSFNCMNGEYVSAAAEIFFLTFGFIPSANICFYPDHLLCFSSVRKVSAQYRVKMVFCS